MKSKAPEVTRFDQMIHVGCNRAFATPSMPHISEDELRSHIEWEEEHGVPYAIAMQSEREKGAPHLTVGDNHAAMEERQTAFCVLTYIPDQCRGGRFHCITEQTVCLLSGNGFDLNVVDLPTDCRVTLWNVSMCIKPPFIDVQEVQGAGASGYYCSRDNFNSNAVPCS